MKSAIKDLFDDGEMTLYRWTHARVLSKYSGGKRKLYEEAYKRLLRRGLGKADAKVKAFVKLERWNPFLGDKDPRIIQFRGKEFTLEYMTFIKAIEEWMYAQKHNGRRIFTKGLNNQQIAELIRDNYVQFGLALSADCSRFDAHVRAWALKFTHRFYLRLINDYLLAWLCSCTILNKCAGATLRYFVYGGRCSGDADTALGNCFLMVVMTKGAMKYLGIARCRYGLVDNGDDLLLFLHDVTGVVAPLCQCFYECGHELEIDAVYSSFWDIEFCHTKPVETGRGITMVRDPARVLSHSVCGAKYMNNVKAIKNLAYTIGCCELSLNAGVPVLQEFALMMRRIGAGGKMLNDAQITSLYAATLDSPGKLREAEPITVQARLSMSVAWDVPVMTQLYLEKWCRDQVVMPSHFPMEGDRWCAK